MEKNALTPEIVTLYDRLIDSVTDLERKGKNTPYTSLNGHMFSFLTKEGIMGLRLSKDDRESFIQKHSTKLMEQHGRVMKEYVVVPPELLADSAELIPYFQKSHTYIATLKPKPTKKK